jgi:hypothetical protein
LMREGSCSFAPRFGAIWRDAGAVYGSENRTPDLGSERASGVRRRRRRLTRRSRRHRKPQPRATGRPPLRFRRSENNWAVLGGFLRESLGRKRGAGKGNRTLVFISQNKLHDNLEVLARNHWQNARIDTFLLIHLQFPTTVFNLSPLRTLLSGVEVWATHAKRRFYPMISLLFQGGLFVKLELADSRINQTVEHAAVA